MKILLLVFFGLLLFFQSESQSSDILILKKKNRTLRTFFPGSEITFDAVSQSCYSCYITSINNDSLFLIQYDVRQVPTNLGVYMLDTVAKYRSAISYKEITGFGEEASRNFDWAGSGGVLLGGGTLLAVVGLGTWVFSKPNTQYYASPYLVGGAAFLAFIGYLLAKSHGKQMMLGKKYSLEYIRVK